MIRIELRWLLGSVDSLTIAPLRMWKTLAEGLYRFTSLYRTEILHPCASRFASFGFDGRLVVRFKIATTGFVSGLASDASSQGKMLSRRSLLLAGTSIATLSVVGSAAAVTSALAQSQPAAIGKRPNI